MPASLPATAASIAAKTPANGSDRGALDSVAVRRFARGAVGILLIAFVSLAAIAAERDSVTIDEFVGLPVGLYTLQAVDFRSESMNPPFFRSFAALPLLSAGALAPRIPPMNEMNDWAVGYRFMSDYGAVYHQLFVPARCMVIFVAGILGALVLQWAEELYGWESGFVALFLFTFSPTILAQAHLVTLDIAGAVGWTSAMYLTWRLLDSPTAWRATLLGFAVGFAPVLKLSGLTVPLVVALLVAVRAVKEPNVPWRTWLYLLSIAYGVALFVLNGLYRFEGFALAFADIDFASSKMEHIATALPWLRLPIPEPFLKSLDVLFVGDEPTEPAYFLAGAWSLEGWWYYHVTAFLLKTSLPLLAVGLVAVAAWTTGQSRGKRDYCVFLPLVFIFCANSVFNPLNIGVRHALPAYPLLIIGAAPWVAAPIERLARGARDPRTIIGAALGVVALVWHLGGTLAIAPRYLEYFNELAGGPGNGHRWLIDSNLDWGQDLLRLRAYMDEEKLSSVHLAYFGRVDPAVYGIRYTPLVEGQAHGITVVSASFLMGRPYWFWRRSGDLQWSHHGAFTWLQKYPPKTRVGSMFVFELP